jgi:hypothetical protein
VNCDGSKVQWIRLALRTSSFIFQLYAYVVVMRLFQHPPLLLVIKPVTWPDALCSSIQTLDQMYSEFHTGRLVHGNGIHYSKPLRRHSPCRTSWNSSQVLSQYNRKLEQVLSGCTQPRPELSFPTESGCRASSLVPGASSLGFWGSDQPDRHIISLCSFGRVETVSSNWPVPSSLNLKAWRTSRCPHGCS